MSAAPNCFKSILTAVLPGTNTPKKTRKKICKRLGLLKRSKQFLTSPARVMFYNALVWPLMDYGACVRGDSFIGHSNIMLLLQRRATSIIMIILLLFLLLLKDWYSQPKYCYEKTIHVVLISFAVVFGLLVFGS